MTAGAPARSLYVAVALQCHRARFLDAEEIRRVVERTGMVRAMEPAAVIVLVALQAVIVPHQRPRRNEIAACGARPRRVEIFCSFPGAGNVPVGRILGM